MDNVMNEYLVRIGAQIDRDAFAGAQRAITSLAGYINKLGNALRFGAAATLFGGVTKAVIENTRAVAALDMEYTKLASNMWVTKETAKSLKMAMDIMGASEQDIAWIPELREQFFRLREEMNALATPADAEGQLKWIREIGYDVESLQLKLKMFREWVVYYLIKYFQPYIAKFQEFIQWLNAQLGSRMPSLANKAAFVLYKIFTVFMSAARAVGYVLGKIYDFFDSMPSKSKKFILAFAAAGAVIMSGPFGMMLTGIGLALLMLEDFMYFLDGKKSSKRLAPLWESLKKLGSSDGMFGKLKEALEWIFDIFNKIINEIHFSEWADNTIEATSELVDAIGGLISKLLDLSGAYKNTDEKGDKFYKKIGKIFDTYLNKGNTLMRVVANIINAFTAALSGDWDKVKFYGRQAFGLWREQNRQENNAWMSMYGNDVSGSAIGKKAAAIASTEFYEGEQWMGGRTANADIQCDSFTAEVYRRAGIQDIGGYDTSGTINDAPFRNNGWYHSADSYYEPQVGDLVDYNHHVGIYVGNGEMISRQSSEGVHRINIKKAEEYFGPLQGYGSIADATGSIIEDPLLSPPLKAYERQGVPKIQSDDVEAASGGGGTYANSFLGNGPSHIFPYSDLPLPGTKSEAQNTSTVNVGDINISVESAKEAAQGIYTSITDTFGELRDKLAANSKGMTII